MKTQGGTVQLIYSFQNHHYCILTTPELGRESGTKDSEPNSIRRSITLTILDLPTVKSCFIRAHHKDHLPEGMESQRVIGGIPWSAEIHSDV